MFVSMLLQMRCASQSASRAKAARPWPVRACKAHRFHRKQEVVEDILDDGGRPINRKMWPGNPADVKNLLPGVVDRLRKSIKIQHFCIVLNPGIISDNTIVLPCVADRVNGVTDDRFLGSIQEAVTDGTGTLFRLYGRGNLPVLYCKCV